MIKLTDKNYNTEISKSNKPIVMFFTTTNCVHCNTVEEILNGLQTNKIQIFIIKNDRVLIEKFNIRAFPTILTYNKEKEPINKVVGYKSKEYLKLQIKSIL